MNLSLAIFFLLAIGGSSQAETCQRVDASRKKAVILYTGVADSDAIPLSNAPPFAPFLSQYGLESIYVRPGEITDTLLQQSALFLIPGGEDVAKPSDAPSEQERNSIRNFLLAGGKYFGACLGAYWAGKEGSWAGTIPGFKGLDLLPATVYSHSTTKEERIEPVLWRDGKTHLPYFQDGPEFVASDESKITVYARYASNQRLAAFSSDFGPNHRNVMVSGMHWEAPADWYKEIVGGDPEPKHGELQFELLTDLLCQEPKKP